MFKRFFVIVGLGSLILSGCGSDDSASTEVVPDDLRAFELTPYVGRNLNDSIAGTWVSIGEGGHLYSSGAGSSGLTANSSKEYFVIREGATGYEKSTWNQGFIPILIEGNNFSVNQIKGVFTSNSSVTATYSPDPLDFRSSTFEKFTMIKVSDETGPIGGSEFNINDVTINKDIYCFMQVHETSYKNGDYIDSSFIYRVEIGGSPLVLAQNSGYLGADIRIHEFNIDISLRSKDSVTIEILSDNSSVHNIRFYGNSESNSASGNVVINLPNL